MACKAQGDTPPRGSGNVGGDRVERGSLAMKGVTIGSMANERRSSGGSARGASSSTGSKAPGSPKGKGGASSSKASVVSKFGQSSVYEA